MWTRVPWEAQRNGVDGFSPMDNVLAASTLVGFRYMYVLVGGEGGRGGQHVRGLIPQPAQEGDGHVCARAQAPCNVLQRAPSLHVEEI